MSAGIVTEMNILPSGVDVLTTLEDATRRRLLFAIIVNDQNEIHRSITVNILHGLTQGTQTFVSADVKRIALTSSSSSSSCLTIIIKDVDDLNKHVLNFIANQVYSLFHLMKIALSILLVLLEKTVSWMNRLIIVQVFFIQL